MSAGFAQSPPRDPLARMRYQLRTPLNRIIGYGDLLLEESRVSDPRHEGDLRIVLENARVVLGHLQVQLWSGDSPTPREKADGLRGEISGPTERVRDLLGNLEASADEQSLPDIRHMRAAADELLSCLRGDPEPPPVWLTHPFPESAPHDGTTPGEHKRILVVDDDETSCDMLRRQLLRRGDDVVCVLSGAEVPDILGAMHFDLILLDLVMPGVSGLDVLERLRSFGLTRSLPVIVMTAFDEMETAARCLELGAEDYLLKPVEPILMRARVRAALERKRLVDAETRRVAELEQAALNLKKANENLNRFAYVASHDLQEPLRTVTTTLQLLSGRFSEGMGLQQKHLIDLANDASRRMSDLIRDLLAWSLTSVQDRVLTDVDLNETLAGVVTNLRQSIEESGATVVAETLPSIRFDNSLLIQLLQNLIGNAIKYRSSRPVEIAISARRQQGHWLMSVRDNGIGIDPEYLDRIFEPFRRLHGHDLPGTGLGLAICARIVAGMGGRIWAESELGAGSVFYFTLPADDLIEPSPVV